MRYRRFWRKGLAEAKTEGNGSGIGQGGFCIRFGFRLGNRFGRYRRKKGRDNVIHSVGGGNARILCQPPLNSTK